MLRGTNIVPAGIWHGTPADVVRLDYDRRTRRRMALVGSGGLSRVLVTHFHPDHIGNADWLAQRFGVELWCPQAEWLMAHLAWQGMGGNDSEKRLNHYRRHGVPPEQAEAFRFGGEEGFKRWLFTTVRLMDDPL